MSVYVDRMRAPLGRMIMCHMLADSTAELLAMADTIGVDQRWLQKRGEYDEHFDIAKSKRALAIAAGAIEISRPELAALLRKKRESETTHSERLPLGDGAVVPLSECPYCAHDADRANGVGHSSVPKPGDVTVCSKCGEVAVFAYDITLRKPYPDEQEEIDNHSELQGVIAHVKSRQAR
jgi:hypothetical protein